jgi:hypothetical protein
MDDKIKAFGAKLEADTRARRRNEWREIPDNMLDHESKVNIKPGKKYTKVDIGGSGKYMVDLNDGAIYGIKAYGVIHKGHQYGTLDTIDDWFWGGYKAFLKTVKSK